MYQIFVPGETHTLACLLREDLTLASGRDLCYCVVTDRMCDEEGLRIQCASKEDLLRVIDLAAMRVRAWRDATTADVAVRT